MKENTDTATPPGYRTVNPYLTVENVPALIDFLQRTFDGVLTEQIFQPGGAVQHTEVRIGDSMLMVGAPQVDAPLPKHAEVRPGTFYVYVADVEATYRRAMVCGANSWQAPTDTFFGDRVAAVVDTNKNVWWIATKQRALTQEQVQSEADRKWRSGKSSV